MRSDDQEGAVSAGLIPDVVFAANERVKELLGGIEGANPLHQAQEQISFLQASIWWYPHGKHYRDDTRKHFYMGLMRDLVELRRTKSSWTKATGLVPVGVSGHLSESVPFQKNERPASLGASTVGPTIDVNIAVYISLRSMFFADDQIKTIEQKNNVRFIVSEYTELDYPRNLPERHPDIAIDGWFGGFNDPEGFLLLLPKLLNVDFDGYLNDIQPIYSAALVEQDWQKRAELFQKFNRLLVSQERMVPTWRVPTFALVSRKLALKATIFRYTHRLTDVVPKKE